MKEKCPYCGEEIHSEYIFCPHCENRLKEKNYKTKNPFHLDMKDAEMKATRKGVLNKLTGMIILFKSKINPKLFSNQNWFKIFPTWPKNKFLEIKKEQT